jgi:hypothetical protein
MEHDEPDLCTIYGTSRHSSKKAAASELLYDPRSAASAPRCLGMALATDRAPAAPR